jgi:hypothetical protein
VVALVILVSLPKSLSNKTILFIDEQDAKNIETMDRYKGNFIINLVIYALQKY